MRLLLLSDRLSERGGADLHLLAVIDELRAAGRHVELAVGQSAVVSTPCPVHLLAGLEARERRPLPLESLISRVRPDLLHLQNVMNPEVLDWAASGRLPALITLQDHRVFCPGRGKWTASGEVCRQPMSRSRCAACFSDGDYFDHIYAVTEARLQAVRRLPVVVLSRYMKSELVAVGVAAGKVRCIPPFVSQPGGRVASGGRPACVLFAGRLVAAKGVAEAVTAWQRARTGLPLVVAGAGPERARLPSLPGLEPAGWLPHREMAGVFARARALLLPSRWQEPFGIVGLEALAHGVPVVGWRSGGVEEWHPGPLREWGDLDGLAAALRSTVEHPESVRPASLERHRRVELMQELIALHDEIAG